MRSDRRRDSKVRWDAADFAQSLAQVKAAQDGDGVKRMLVQVAEHNYQMRDWWPIPRTVPCSHSDCLSHVAKPVSKDPQITLSTMTTAEALLHFAQQNRRVCALNFANGSTVGGGYKNGATAQEEDLCRQIPVLYTSLNNASRDGLYPFGPSTYAGPTDSGKYSDVLYTTGLTIARDSMETGYAVLPDNEQVRVSLVSAAAPNIRFAKEVASPEMIYSTIQSVFIAPNIMEPDVDTLVLGAFGCGAFGNDPQTVAEQFVQALIRDNYGQLYREVHFAIPRLSPKDNNYEVFSSVFKSFKLNVKMI